MSITAIVFVLIILLFAFDSKGQVKTRGQRTRVPKVRNRSRDVLIRAGDEAGNVIETDEDGRVQRLVSVTRQTKSRHSLKHDDSLLRLID